MTHIKNGDKTRTVLCTAACTVVQIQCLCTYIVVKWDKKISREIAIEIILQSSFMTSSCSSSNNVKFATYFMLHAEMPVRDNQQDDAA